MKKLATGIITTGILIASCSNAGVSVKEKVEKRPSAEIINGGENLSDEELLILTMKNLVEDLKKQRGEIEKIKAMYGIQKGKIEKIKKINLQLEQKMKKLQDQIILRDQIISQQFKKIINNLNKLQEEIKQIKLEKNPPVSKKMEENKGIVIKNSNIRSEPKMGNNVIEYARKGDEVEIIGKEGNWLKIRYKNKEGFIHKKLVVIQ